MTATSTGSAEERAMNPEASNLGHPGAAAIVFFFLFLAVSLGVTFWAARRTRSTEEFYAAGRQISAGQNGLALAGDFLAAAGFLGITGLISLVGFDGVMIAVGGVVGWPVMLFLLAEPLRNLGKYTFADVLSYRVSSASIRVYSGICSLVTVFMFLIIQMVGAGSLVQLLFGFSYELSVVIVGAVMIAYVLFGGMIAATWVQIIKCVLMIGTVITLAFLVLKGFDFSPAAVFRAAVARNGPAVLAPGGIFTPLEMLSVGFTTIIGIAAFPHVLMRFYTVPDARAARISMLYATILVAVNLLSVFMLGFGAMALIGSNVIRGVERGGNMALPLLAERLGGLPFLGFVSAVAFATLLASVTAILITGAATLSHDLWVSVVRRGQASPREQLVVAKIATVVLGIIAIFFGIAFRGQNLGLLTVIASAVPAASSFPALVLAIYWRRFTKEGAIAGMMGGLGATLLLLYLSPVIQVDLLHHAAPILGLRNPGIVAIPFAFLLAIVVSLATHRKTDEAHYAEVERRMLVGWNRG
jgi:cation/acetate symporter